MEYCQFGGADSAKLEWSGPGQSREVVPAGAAFAPGQAPVYYLPGAQTSNENTPLVFTTANGNAITISDVDAQSDLLPGYAHGDQRLADAWRRRRAEFRGLRPRQRHGHVHGHISTTSTPALHGSDVQSLDRLQRRREPSHHHHRPRNGKDRRQFVADHRRRGQPPPPSRLPSFADHLRLSDADLLRGTNAIVIGDPDIDTANVVGDGRQRRF